MIIVGQPIPMSLQLSDPDTTRYVRAFVYNPAGTVLGQVDLVSRGSGLYSQASFAMPNHTFVVVQYRVYADDQYSVLDPNYGLAAETFLRLETGDTTIEVIGELTGSLLEA